MGSEHLSIRRWLLAVLACLSTIPALAATTIDRSAHASEIERLLSDENLRIGGVEILARAFLSQAYAENHFQPFWIDGGNIRELQDLIATAEEHGLHPEDYGATAISAALARQNEQPGAPVEAGTDILLTESLFRYGYHRRLGKIKASTLDPRINYRRESYDGRSPAALLRHALKAPSLQGFIDTLAPSGPIYRALQRWLAHYRLLAKSGGWPMLSAGPSLRAGDTGPRVAALRARLRVTGELTAAAPMESEQAFDMELESAVRRFQQQHALPADGIVGRQTLQALNVPIAQRIDQLRLSLERLRWVNQEAADTLVAVNIAGYRAFFVRDGKLIWESRAMVGRTYRQTPTFRGDMASLELNPDWTIPPGILRRDTLPAIRRDPGYLTTKHIRVLDGQGREVDPATIDWSLEAGALPYVFRQDPGPWNALGTVKFIFPNPYFVFLHDTPDRALFEQPDRAFSSGCIRIENPLVLAELVLADRDRYSLAALQELVASGVTRRIPLARTVPVLIVYLTANIDDDGGLLLYRDVYGRDARDLVALDGPVVLDPPLRGG